MCRPSIHVRVHRLPHHVQRGWTWPAPSSDVRCVYPGIHEPFLAAAFHRCTPLPARHPCRRVSPSSYTFTQFVPGFPIIIEGPDIDVALLLFDNLSPPEQCSDSLLYLACLLFALPCDPDSGLPYPVCERSCRAFQLQRTKGTCEQLNEELRAIGESPAFDLEGFTTIANINDNFDCSNTSTFVFLETNFSRDDCTDILSAHVVAEIETSIG